MPNMGDDTVSNSYARLLLIGDGKCGKSYYAGMAGAAGFNVLYLDGDVGAETLHELPMAAKKNIYLVSINDTLGERGLVPSMFNFIENFFTARSPIQWNDTEQRLYNRLLDKEDSTDTFWSIKPWLIDKQTVLVIDSWTALVQSMWLRVCEENGLDPSAIDEDERRKLRSIYQVTQEKANMYLQTIRSLRCHVIVIAHPNEFVKTEKPSGKTQKQISESDLKILWTKMVPKSTSNNHAFTMARFFTDVGWLEVGAMGDYRIDFRPSPEKISGSHMNKLCDANKEGAFVELVKKLGGHVPTEVVAPRWLTVQQGVEQTAKPKVIETNPTKPTAVSFSQLMQKKETV